MYRSLSLLSAFCLGVFVLPTALFCQTPTDQPLPVDAQQMRHALIPRSPHPILRVYNLVPGKDYRLVLSSTQNLTACSPTAMAVDMGARCSAFDPTARELLFRPSASTMDFQLDYACDWDQAQPPTQYVSIVCQDCVHKDLKEVLKDASVLQVAGGQSAEDLIRNVLVGGNCFDVSNITYAGRAGQIGTFSNGNNNIGFSNGVVMATGSINASPGPNNLDDASGDYGNVTPDVDLSTLTTSNYLYDMADIEFDFTPTQSPASFQFVFASEEYCEFVNSPFNDVFGFFISGPGYVGNSNIALIPSTTTPVTINNVNHLSNAGYFVNNTGPGGILCGQAGSLSPSVAEVQFDGYTTKLTATAVVEACQTYHIKLKVADVEDGIYDSAVFLNARSFDAGGDASVEFVVNGDANNDQIYEGCGTVQLVFRRVGANPNSALVVPYSVSGTAVAGLDYATLPNSVVIPAGQNTVTIPVTILTDALQEAQETLIITLADACSCLHPQEILYLNDLVPLQVTADTVKICGPGTGTLSALTAGGVAPFTYLWSNGLSAASISPFDTVSTSYTVTVTDACGDTQVAATRLHIDPLPKAELQSPAPQLCPGQSGSLMMQLTGTGPFDLVYSLNGAAQPVITDITGPTYSLSINQTGLYQIASVVDSLGCAGPGQGSLLVVSSSLNMDGAVTNVPCAGQTNGAVVTLVTGGQGPFTYAWAGPQSVAAVPNPIGLMAGQYQATVTDVFGCQDMQTFNITEPSALVPAIVNVVGPNCYNASGGSIDLSVAGGVPNYTYVWTGGSTVQDPQNLGTGTYAVTITDQAMCTQTAIATVTGNFVAPQALAAAADTLSCTTLAISLDGTGSSSGLNYMYQWTAAPGHIIGDSSMLQPVVDLPGVYTLQVTDANNGCTAASPVSVVSAVAYPNAQAGPDRSLTCVLTNVALNASGSSQGPAFSYAWTASAGGTILGDATVLNPLIGTTGTYMLVVTDHTNGCTATDNVLVDNNMATPTAVIAPPALLSCVNNAVTLAGGASLPATGLAYQWSTLDGFIQSGQAAANAVVTEPGHYTLLVTNLLNGCTNTSSVTVLNDASVPVANAAVSGNLNCSTQVLTLDGTGSSSGGDFILQWTSSTGSGFVSGDTTLLPVINAPGTYTLLITNTTTNCAAFASVFVGQDLQPPAADAGAPAVLGCTVTELSLGDSSAVGAPHIAYQWTTADGNILSGSNTPTPTINLAGTYLLTVVDSTTGCTNTASVTINQNITPPTAAVASAGQLDCATPTVQLDGSNSSTGATFSYQWTSGAGGNIGAGATTLTPTATAAGVYTLVVTNAANGCTASASATVTTTGTLPTAVATALDTLTCTTSQIAITAAGSSAGANFSYQWGTLNGVILAGQGSAQITVGAPGSYTLIVTNTTDNCTASFAVTAPNDLTAPLAVAGGAPVLLCTVASMQLDGTGSSTGAGYQYLWSGPGIVSGNTTLTPTINAAGDYQIVVTNSENGCTQTDIVQIGADINDPVVQIAVPAALDCGTTQINLDGMGSSAGSNFSYQWTGPGLLQGNMSLTPLVNAPGDYTLVITNSVNGCSSEGLVAVSQDIQLPPADAGPDSILTCTFPQIQIGGLGNPAGSGYSFSWSGPGLVANANTPYPVVEQGGLYSLTVTNTATGCSKVDETTVATDFAVPQANAGTTFQLTCSQDTFVLQATASVGSNFTYNWSSNTGSFISPTNILHPTVNGAGQYNLLVTNTLNGCQANSSVQITQSANLPAAVATTPGILNCSTPNLTLSGAGSSTGPNFLYQWTSPNGGNLVGGASTLNPVVDQPATYLLQVTDTLTKCTSNSSVNVTADLAPPIIDAGQEPTLTCTHPVLSLQGSVGSNGTFTYLWAAQNGGNILSGITTLHPEINAAGTYVLTVTSQQNGCSSTASVIATVDQMTPVVVIQSPADLTCAVQKVPLDASASASPGNFSYSWTTVNGHFAGSTDSLIAQADQSGTYTLLITNVDNGCTTAASTMVDQDKLPPTANAGNNGLLTCSVTLLELNGNGSSQNGNYFYEWTTTDGQILTGMNGLHPMITSGGLYTLVVINELNGCSASDATLVTVDTLSPTVAIASPGQLTCTQPQVTLNGSGSQGGPGIAYAWTTLDGNIVSGQSSKLAVVDASGTYTLHVLNAANGCSGATTAQVSDNIILPIADAGSPFTLTCSTEQVTLQGAGSSGPAYSYNWTAQSGGSIVSGANTPNPLVNQPGIYTLTVTNAGTGCRQTDAVTVYRETNIPTAFKKVLINPGCNNDNGVIRFDTVIGGVGPYLYSIDAGQHYFSETVFANIVPGSYTLHIQDANGCVFSQNLIVPPAPSVNVSLIPEVNIDLGGTFDLQATLPPGYPLALIDTVIWSPLDGLSFAGTDILHLLNPIGRPFESTEYTVTIVTVDQCEASDRVLVWVNSEPHIYIPNAFSPWDANNDNDIVLIFADGEQIDQVDNFQIFDRWGEMVFYDHDFQPNDPAHGWDGYHLGQLMVPAVFVYYAVIKLIDGRKLLYKGDITLVR